MAAALGANRADTDDGLIDENGYSWNERRALALARGEKEPSWDDQPITAREIADMNRLMAGAPQGLVPPSEE